MKAETRKIQWSYLGPFFDGEGSVGLYLVNKQKRIGINPVISITNKGIFLSQIKEFLDSENIFSDQQQMSVRIYHWKDVEKFIDKILPFTILKRKELTLLKQACKIHHKYNSNNNPHSRSSIKDHVGEYAKIALKISSFKGLKGSKNGTKKYVLVIKEVLKNETTKII